MLRYELKHVHAVEMLQQKNIGWINIMPFYCVPPTHRGDAHIDMMPIYCVPLTHRGDAHVDDACCVKFEMPILGFLDLGGETQHKE